MNKQEFQQTIKNMKCEKDCVYMSSFEVFKKGFEKAKELALLHSNSLDEPEKPIVPQFVAGFYESIKDDLEDGVYELCVQFYEDESEPSTNLYRWFYRDDNKPIETLVKMRLYGYEVERYKVALKSNGFGIGVHQEDGRMKTVFTRNELAEYGFNNLDEYEVREVEDD